MLVAAQDMKQLPAGCCFKFWAAPCSPCCTCSATPCIVLSCPWSHLPLRATLPACPLTLVKAACLPLMPMKVVCRCMAVEWLIDWSWDVADVATARRDCGPRQLGHGKMSKCIRERCWSTSGTGWGARWVMGGVGFVKIYFFGIWQQFF